MKHSDRLFMEKTSSHGNFYNSVIKTKLKSSLLIYFLDMKH
uniref:Uncharacterized protein n=1 Tax=Lepeophtheirus salmonis TaxID=72036 RepID=A0A0K2VJQ3_LEPSM